VGIGAGRGWFAAPYPRGTQRQNPKAKQPKQLGRTRLSHHGPTHRPSEKGPPGVRQKTEPQLPLPRLTRGGGTPPHRGARSSAVSTAAPGRGRPGHRLGKRCFGRDLPRRPADAHWGPLRFAQELLPPNGRGAPGAGGAGDGRPTGDGDVGTPPRPTRLQKPAGNALRPPPAVGEVQTRAGVTRGFPLGSKVSAAGPKAVVFLWKPEGLGSGRRITKTPGAVAPRTLQGK